MIQDLTQETYRLKNRATNAFDRTASQRIDEEGSFGWILGRGGVTILSLNIWDIESRLGDRACVAKWDA